MEKPSLANGSTDDVDRARALIGMYENAAQFPPHEGVATDMTNLDLALDTYAQTTDAEAQRIYWEGFAVAARRLRTMRKIFSKGYLVTVGGSEWAELFARNLTATIEKLEAIVPAEG